MFAKRLLISALLTSILFQVHADTHYVDINNGSPSSPYTSWATAATNIQTAVDAAISGDTVLVTNGTYLLSSELVVGSAITVESMNGPASTIVDGNNSVRCFNLAEVACVLCGLSMVNGQSTGSWKGAGPMN
jgi:hypothetical protein